MMKKFIKLTFLYIVLLLGLFFISLEISSYIVTSRTYKNHETESNLLIYEKNQQYDVLFMGISHARNFSRHKNHLKIEDITDKKIINIGQGEGRCGINEQLFYLDYFYNKKNKTETVLYIISPPLFFSENLAIASNTFDHEPFDISFFSNYLFFDSENKRERIISYLQSKFRYDWLSYKPHSLDSKNEKLYGIDNEAVAQAQKLIYQNPKATTRFEKSKQRVEETIQLALKNNSKVILIIPPSLFGKWERHDDVENFAKKMTSYKGVQYHDFSESVLNPNYYYDHHHLNTNGIVFFTENFLNPILK